MDNPSTFSRQVRNLFSAVGVLLSLVCADGRAQPSEFIRPLPSNASTLTPNQFFIQRRDVTPDSIHRNFARRIELNFLSGDPNRLIASLTLQELADLAALYAMANANDTTPLLRIIAQTSNGATLQKTARAFGEYETRSAVQLFATADVKQQYILLPALPAIYASQPAYQAIGHWQAASSNTTTTTENSSNLTGGPSPTIDFTLREIYLDYRTAPIGSLSARAALTETAIYAAGRLVPAYATGTVIGTGINSLLITYSPETVDAIGGTLAGMVDNLSTATTHLAQGKVMEAINALFGSPLPINSSGDGGIYYPTIVYIEAGGRSWCGKSRCPPIQAR